MTSETQLSLTVNWKAPVTKPNGQLRKFEKWKVPHEIVEHYGLADKTQVSTTVRITNASGDEKEKIGDYDLVLTSGTELRLSTDAQSAIRTHAGSDPACSVHFEIKVPLQSQQSLWDAYERRVKESQDAAQQRQESLTSALPKRIPVWTFEYLRNPKVAAEVLSRANGLSEACKRKAPFLRASDNNPYLEVHHKKRLADGGEDTVENAVVLCPNCHRKQHHGLPDAI